MEKGREKGREEGRREEAFRLLLRLLTHQFGAVPEPLQARLNTLTLDQIEACMDVTLSTQSLTEFADQLPPPTDATTPGASYG